MDSLCANLDDCLGAAIRDLSEKRTAVAEAARRILEEEADLRRRSQQLQEREEAVANREEEVERSSEEMKQAMARLEACTSDIIGLSFGGERIVKVKRSLLLQFEGSMLATMFSGRHDDKLDRDEQGNAFLDYSPDILSPLIEFLRLHRDVSPQGVRAATPDIPMKHQAAWCAMLDFMGLPDALKTPAVFHGVREYVKLSEMHGWTLVFSKPYSHKTSMEDFIPSDERLRGGSLLVGARRAGSNVLSVAAMGHADVVTSQHADGRTTFHNEVYWYCCSGKSVGFAPVAAVELGSADTLVKSSSQRLSWHLQGMGGYRAGQALELNQSDAWEKIILASSVKVDVRKC